MTRALIVGDLDTDLIIEGKHLDIAEESGQLLQLAALLNESICTSSPAVAEEIIEAWERDLGLSITGTPTLADRRLLVIGKMRASGGLSVPFFESIAEGFGFGIGTHGEVGDPHLRITEGEFKPFKADIGQVDVDAIYDQDAGASVFTWCVYGTSVESHSLLTETFLALRPAWTEVLFFNE